MTCIQLVKILYNYCNKKKNVGIVWIGIVENEMKILTLKLFQTCVNFFLLLNTKDDILKNVSNQTVDGPSMVFLFFFFQTMEVKWANRLFGYPYSSKYHLLC